MDSAFCVATVNQHLFVHFQAALLPSIFFCLKIQEIDCISELLVLL